MSAGHYGVSLLWLNNEKWIERGWLANKGHDLVVDKDTQMVRKDRAGDGVVQQLTGCAVIKLAVISYQLR